MLIANSGRTACSASCRRPAPLRAAHTTSIHSRLQEFARSFSVDDHPTVYEQGSEGAMRNLGARIAARRGRGTVKGSPRRRMQPAVVALEDRRLLSTFTVTSTTDDGSAGTLRWAVGQADFDPGNNTIDFDSTVFNTPQTITLSEGQLELSNTSGTETVTGPTAGVTISGGGLSRVFQVDSGVSATISGLTITGGSTTADGGGAYNHGGTFTLIDCAVSGNSAEYGGGLATNDYGTTTVVNCTVTGNSSSENGGGLFNSYGTTALSGCTVSGNYAAVNGGGLFSSFGTTALTDCVVSGNSASNNGGGLYNFVGTIESDSCTFSINSAVNGGGFSTSSARTRWTRAPSVATPPQRAAAAFTAMEPQPR